MESYIVTTRMTTISPSTGDIIVDYPNYVTKVQELNLTNDAYTNLEVLDEDGDSVIRQTLNVNGSDISFSFESFPIGSYILVVSGLRSLLTLYVSKFTNANQLQEAI